MLEYLDVHRVVSHCIPFVCNPQSFNKSIDHFLVLLFFSSQVTEKLPGALLEEDRCRLRADDLSPQAMSKQLDITKRQDEPSNKIAPSRHRVARVDLAHGFRQLTPNRSPN